MNELTPEEKYNQVQAELNEMRDKRKIEFTDGQLMKLEVIEKASKMLDEAQVPFLLLASSQQAKDGTCTHWWQFNKFAWDETFEQRAARSANGRSSLMGFAFEFFSKGTMGYIVIYNEDKEPVGHFYNGVYTKVSKPTE